jgi:hypothetical protein
VLKPEGAGEIDSPDLPILGNEHIGQVGVHKGPRPRRRAGSRDAALDRFPSQGDLCEQRIDVLFGLGHAHWGFGRYWFNLAVCIESRSRSDQ